MNTFRCPKCGLLNFADAKCCKRCKTEFHQEANDFAAGTADDNAPSGFDNISSNNPVGNFTREKNQSHFTPPSFESNQQTGWQNQNQSPPPRSYNPNFQPQNQPHFGEAPLYSSPAPKLKSGLAIASMVLGIISAVSCIISLGLPAIVGLVLGIIALVKAKKRPSEYGGQGFAIAGIALNGIFVVSFPVILAIGVPNFLAARRVANEGAAISSMRTLTKAESEFINSDAATRCGDLTDLLGAGLIDATLAGGEKTGYKYTIAKNADGSCELFAVPLVSSGVGKTGTRSFYASTDEWEIHAADKNGARAGKNDPILNLDGPLNGPQRTRASKDDY